MAEFGIWEKDGKFFIPERTFYHLCDVAEEIGERGELEFENPSTLKDMKSANVERHVGWFLPYLLFLDHQYQEGLRDGCARGMQETGKYVNKILRDKVEIS